MEVYTVKVDKEGSIHWHQNDRLHRLDGPALECADGTLMWYQNGQPHRLDGPAIEFTDGDRQWYQNGQLHRLDGPAVEFADGGRRWYIEGEKLTEEEFKIRTQPVKELTVSQIQELLGFEIRIVKG